MNTDILRKLIAQRVDPIQFQFHGDTLVWMSPDYDTLENRAIVEDVIANYDTLAAEYEASQAILLQIIALEALQTPRRLREAVSDPSWMNDLDSQIAELRNKL